MKKTWLTALVAVFLCACAAPSPYEPGNCERYGVLETGNSMGAILIAEERFQDDLEVVCGEPEPPHERAGCVIQVVEGVAIFWRHDDPYAKNHEICHALNGPEHTEKYERDLANGHPAPYMPDIFGE